MKIMMAQEIEPVSITRLLNRYGSGRRRRKMEPIYQSMLKEVNRMGEPAAMYAEFPPALLPELTPWLPPKTNSLFLALCTLGPQLHDYFLELIQEDFVAAAVFDEITLTWVTAITRQIHHLIRSDLEGSDLKGGPAFRPGVGRWPLLTQQTVFAHLPSEKIGVTLDENLVMTPKQSTSLIIPLLKRNG